MDDIKRKLDLIDGQLAPKSLHRHIIQTCPLLFTVIGLIIGIVVQNIMPLPLQFWFFLLFAIASGAVLFFIFSREPRPAVIAYAAAICFICLGAIRLYSFNQPNANDIRNFTDQQPTLATIRGNISSEPYINRNLNWEFAKFDFSDPSCGFYLNVTEVETVQGWERATGIVRVQVSGPVVDLKSGDSVELYCMLERFNSASNPGQFDMKKYMARKNIYIAASVKSRGSIELLQNNEKSIFTKLKTKLRESTNAFLVGDIAADEAAKGLLQALLLGYRGDIDPDTYEAFRKTGLLHFISLSGMHLGILAGIVWWLCKTAGLLKRGRAIICTIVIIVFLLIVPPRAPTVRAAIITWVFCASFLFARKSNSINTLSLAAIILLLTRPTNIFEVGWQLSFASVLGIILFTDKINFFIYENFKRLPLFAKAAKTKPYSAIIAGSGPFTLKLLSVGISAWLGGAGILLYHFYTITPLTSIWTVVVFPFVALILTFGYLKIVLALLLPSLASLLGVIVTALSDILIAIVKFIAALNISEILIGKVTIWIIACFYSLILMMRLVNLRNVMLKRIITAAFLGFIATFLIFTKWHRTYNNDLVLTTLDVGHGQAVFVRLPSKTNLLFDAGSMYRSDIGRKVIIPFLDHSGTRKIDGIIISHNDTDHINGIPEIVKYRNVGGVYANDAFFTRTDRWGTAKFLKESLVKKGITIQRLSENPGINSKAKVEFLWPQEKIMDSRHLTDNDKSQVTMIEYVGEKILICSDIEKYAQEKIMESYPDLKADIVVVPHHGSVSSMDTQFIEKLNPEVLVFSCGRSQYERLQNSVQNKTSSLYTYNDGTITISIDKNGSIKILKHN
ncbi:MAG: DNA internalization-related competence protein ComEC/Rec2 [Planctomycetota bacterium]|jgi:competence protein ComEC